MLHLASCLPRRTLHVYQQAQDGNWAPGYDRAQPSSQDDFFLVEGLPTTRQGGRGHVALIVEVTRSIRDKAIADFQARYPSELLAIVCLRPVNGPSSTAVEHPGQVARAADQFRHVLDTLHERFEGAESVLLAMDCPSSVAAALGTVINPNAQHTLWLHHFEPESKRYVPVHLLRSRRATVSSRSVVPTSEQILNATRVLGEVRKVHGDLVTWLKEPEQRDLVEAMDGQILLQSRIEDTPATTTGPLFRHVGGTWSFHVDLLLGLGALRTRLGAQDDWKECIRLFLIHEVYHVRQGGLTSYNYSGSGRTGFVLEVVDYDADEIAVQVAFAWRKAKQSGTVQDEGETKTLEAIIWNVLESLRVFEPERPIRDLSERRLRRYLIWLFHACRLAALAVQTKTHTQLERVTIEVAGLPTFPDPHENYAQPRVRLEGMNARDPLAVAVYYQRKLVRETDGAWVVRVLDALRRWDEQPRSEAQDAMRLLFEEFFNRHRFLLDPKK